MHKTSEVGTHDWVSDIKVISFDLDDTLWDCAPAIALAEQALMAWLEKHAPKVIDEHGEQSIVRRRSEIVKSHPEFACDMTLLRHKMIEVGLVEAGYPASTADDAFEVFYQARSQVTLYEGTHEVLDALSQRYKLAVITNGNADLSIIGLADYFDHIQRASIDNAPKPQAAMFDTCLKVFNVEGNQLAHIGDNVETDVGGGRNVGARTVWYKQPNTEWPDAIADKPDAHVNSLKELQALFLQE